MKIIMIIIILPSDAIFIATLSLNIFFRIIKPQKRLKKEIKKSILNTDMKKENMHEKTW